MYHVSEHSSCHGSFVAKDACIVNEFRELAEDFMV
jgi:hypothetical protein